MNLQDNTTAIPRKSAVLSIAGSDSGGNAGVQADLRAFHTFGVHGCTAITALTAQNPFSVNGIFTADGAFVRKQIDAVIDIYDIRALKTGMLCNADIIGAVADNLACHNRILKVIDPVMIATSGAKLLEDNAIEQMKSNLLPLATLITPNLPEAETLLAKVLDTNLKIADAAKELYDKFGCATLIKGGHNTNATARDLLFDGANMLWFESPVVEAPLSTHGTGCSLSAAITASLAKGKELTDAIAEGKAYVYESIRTGINISACAAVLGTPQTMPVNEISIKKYERD